MQIGASTAYATQSYQQAQPQQNGQAAIAALDARQPTSAPVETQAAVRPNARAADTGRSVEDYKKDDRAPANDARADAKPTSGRGQLVDIRA